jgi:hypothetical protein
MIDPKELAAWLLQEPLPEEIEMKDGGFYIPIEIIISKLDMLDESWGRKSASHTFFSDHNGELYCSGTVELDIQYRLPLLLNNLNGAIESYKTIKRTIAGGATFKLDQYAKEGNTHYAAICLSLCTVSAAQHIAPCFGKNLNKPVATKVDRGNAISKTMRQIK